MPDIERYTPPQLADEVQNLAESYRGAVDEVETDNSIFDDISTAIQGKTGQVEPYAKSEMADTISDDLVFPSGTLNISSNGDYDVSAKETAHVAVPGPTLITKQITVNGTYSAEDDNADGYSEVTVDVAQPQPLEEKDVNFYDYDGTVLYAYTAQEALALTELPEAPTHEGLTFQGWNRTLNDLKAYITDYGVGDIGATYITDDGVTRIYLYIDDNTSLDCELYVNIEKGTLVVEVDGVVLGSGTVPEGYADVVIPFTLPHRGEVCVELKFEGIDFALSHYHGTVGDDEVLRQDVYSGFLDNEHNDSVVKVLLGSGFYFDTFPKAFQNFSSLRYINFYTGDDVGDIREGYFQNCSSLEFFILPESFDDIEKDAFQNCSSLKRIIIPNTIQYLGGSLGDPPFQNCVSLKEILIPSSVTSIGGSAFQNCSSLKEITIPTSITSISENCFQNCSSLKKVTLHNSVRYIYTGAFQSCVSLKSITIPTSVTSISANCFQNCSSLINVLIPSSVTSIDVSAFQDCSSLEEIVIPSSVTYLSTNVFQGCVSLSILDISEFPDNKRLFLMNANALADTPDSMKILVANQTQLDAYKAASNWSVYADRFQIKGASS